MATLDMIIEGFIIRELFNQHRGSNSNYIKLSKILINKLIPHINNSIKELRCPYCGRKFTTKGALKNHLMRTATKLAVLGGSGLRHVYSIPTNKCASNFLMEITRVVEIYREFTLEIGRNPQKYKILPKWLEERGYT